MLEQHLETIPWLLRGGTGLCDKLKRLHVDADDVLVGHSLDCDLRALGLAHHACADTALELYDLELSVAPAPSARRSAAHAMGPLPH